MLSVFAAEGTGVPLAAEPVFSLAGVAVTNSMVLGLLTGAAVVAIYLAAGRRSTLHPRSLFTFATETIVEFFLNTAHDNFGDRQKAAKHVPLLLTLFSF